MNGKASGRFCKNCYFLERGKKKSVMITFDQFISKQWQLCEAWASNDVLVFMFECPITCLTVVCFRHLNEKTTLDPGQYPSEKSVNSIDLKTSKKNLFNSLPLSLFSSLSFLFFPFRTFWNGFLFQQPKTRKHKHWTVINN